MPEEKKAVPDMHDACYFGLDEAQRRADIRQKVSQLAEKVAGQIIEKTYKTIVYSNKVNAAMLDVAAIEQGLKAEAAAFFDGVVWHGLTTLPPPSPLTGTEANPFPYIPGPYKSARQAIGAIVNWLLKWERVDTPSKWYAEKKLHEIEGIKDRLPPLA